jgi:predicted MPP superfamily phosphohydrolase
MPRTSLYIFLAVFLTGYGLVNAYIFIRGWPATAWMRRFWRKAVLLLFWLSVLSYPLGRFLSRLVPLPGEDGLVLIGSFYLAVMIYLFLVLLFLDTLRLIRCLLPPVLKKRFQPSGIAPRTKFLMVIGIVLITVSLGHWNALHPRIRNLEINLPQSAGSRQQLSVVLASDLHLGRIIRNSRLEKIVGLINGLKPDLVLLAGDLTDEDIPFLSDQNTAVILQRIQAPLGVYSVTGNHEYYSGIGKSVSFIRQGHIRVLEDETVKIGDSLYLVGRKDRTAERFGEPRKPLGELMKEVPPGYPVILMDHQPFQLAEAQRQGVGLQLSGHTHNGQLFPINFIIGRIYENPWGYLKKGDTHYYVSCGVGTWGPPVRTCSIPEIVHIRLTLQPGP